ncbi:sulfotransferase 1 [Branchiostoma belcheri]|nr:sulfotransferase 1 [Branchiostoma belcheri]
MEQPQLFEYKGAVFDPRLVSKDSLDIIPDYVIRDDDVVIVTYPKTGTHWIVEIVNKLMRAAGKTVVDTQDIPLAMETTLPGFDKPGHVILKDRPSPRIIHTQLPWHLAPKMITSPAEGKVKVIVVMRNPKDTAVSRYHYVRKLQALMGVQALTTWEQHVQDFLDGKGTYATITDLPDAVTKTKEFWGISLDDVTTTSIVESCTFANLSTGWASSQNQIQRLIARKGVVGDWQNMFTESQNKAYDARYNKRLKGTGLQFDFE